MDRTLPAVVAALFVAGCGPATSSGRAPLDVPATPPPLRPLAAAALFQAASLPGLGDAAPGVLRSAEGGGLPGDEVYGPAAEVYATLAFDGGGARHLFLESREGPSFIGFVWYLERRASDGTPVWATRRRAVADSHMTPWYFGGVSPSGDTVVYAGGPGHRVARLDPDGEPAWETSADPFAVGPIDAALPTPDGGAAVFHLRPRDGRWYPVLTRLDAAGFEVGPPVDLGPADAGLPCSEGEECEDRLSPGRVGIDASGEIVLLQRNVLRKLRADLAERWRIELAPSPASEQVRVAAGADGSVAVLAEVDDERRYTLTSIAADGEVRWSFAGIEWDGRQVPAIAVDAAGRVALHTRGSTTQRIVVLGVDGEPRWAVAHPNFAAVTSMAFDPGGGLAVAGVFGQTTFLGVRAVPGGPTDAFVLQFEP